MSLKNINMILGTMLLVMGCSSSTPISTKAVRATTNDKIAMPSNTMRTENRVALVIGNNNYHSAILHKLHNPINDANAIKNILEERNFKVIFKKDMNREETEEVLEKFYKEIKDGGVGLLYFSGHGIEVEKKNYLIPLGAEIKKKKDIKYQATPLNQILDRMEESGNRLNIVILDACRNDPFSKSANSGGLSEVIPPRGVFVAYATGAGNVSSDGEVGENGRYTKYLIENMKQPLELYDVFKKTKDEVYIVSNLEQNPAIYNESMGTFYFTLPKDGDKPIEYQPSFQPKIHKSSSKSLSINIKESLKNRVSVDSIGKSPLTSVITIQNHQNQRVTVYYRFKWFDKDGIEVGEGMSAWIPTFIDPNDSKTIKGSPPVPNAVNGKFYIK